MIQFMIGAFVQYFRQKYDFMTYFVMYKTHADRCNSNDRLPSKVGGSYFIWKGVASIRGGDGDGGATTLPTHGGERDTEALHSCTPV